jgi:hypothetical protein
MLPLTEEALRALLPNATNDEIEAAGERLRRYIELAIAMAEEPQNTPPSGGLTLPESRGSVKAGQVDPGTFTNTG